ncbi:MAG TPA: DoxX family protein [Membranihabitans sp.]|nr:DoxX family protein [Membranihabitans sp.]
MVRSQHSSVFYLLTGAVAIIYLFTGLRKLIGYESVVADFESWGFHPAFMYIIGITELAGAIALMIPKARIPAITGLGVVMLGAIGTHIYSEEYYQILLPLALLLLLISLLFMSRKEIDDANMREHDQANY